jgi:hypothetical protein
MYLQVDNCERGKKLHLSSPNQRLREPQKELSCIAYIHVLCLLYECKGVKASNIKIKVARTEKL